MNQRDLLLRANALSVGFGLRAILPPIDLSLRRGELWGLVGRNGAGKTTLLRTLLGLAPPVSGAVDGRLEAEPAIAFPVTAPRASVPRRCSPRTTSHAIPR